MKMNLYVKTHLHMNRVVHRLVLMQRQKANRERLSFNGFFTKFARSLLSAGSQIKCTIHRPEIRQVITMRFDNEKIVI